MIPLDLTPSAADWDGAWKQALTALLQAFMAMFFPRVYDEIDWSRGYEPVDKELPKLAGDAAIGDRHANDRARRRIWKVRLLTGLYNRGWKREDVRQLLGIIDWFLLLPPEENRLVHQEIESDEKERQMAYITSFEQIAVEDAEARGEARGQARGRAAAEAAMEGQKYAIALALKFKFGSASAGLAAEIQEISDIETLKRIAESIEPAVTIHDVRRA